MYIGECNVPCLCPYCYSKLKSVPNLDYVPNKRRKDFYYTSDGFCIVSQKFKDFCDEGRYGSLDFQKLNTSDFYFFEPRDIFKTNIRWIPFNVFKILCVVIKVLIFVNYMRCVVKLKVEIDKFARKSI